MKRDDYVQMGFGLVTQIDVTSGLVVNMESAT